MRTPGRVATLAATFLLLALAGCVSLASAAIDAGFRDAEDHGRNAKYENKSYGAHFVDALLESDDDDSCHCGHCSRCRKGGGR